jgi:hypothetical protein
LEADPLAFDQLDLMTTTAWKKEKGIELPASPIIAISGFLLSKVIEVAHNTAGLSGTRLCLYKHATGNK